MYNPFFISLMPKRRFEAPGEEGVATPPTDTPPAADTPPAEGTPPADTPPVSAVSGAAVEEVAAAVFEDIALPEGYEIPEDAREGFLELVNNPELSRADLVSGLIAMQAEQAGDPAVAMQQAASELFATTQTEWQTELAALPTFGGANLDQNLAEVKQGMELAGASPEAFAALNVTGAGNHPALVPFLHKLVKPYLEAAPVTTTPSEGKLSREATMFPDMK